METILEVIERISFLATTPSLIGLFVALALLLLSRRWRIHALGMALIYFFTSLLHTRVIHPGVAAVKLLIGLMVALTLYMTGRHLSELEREESEQNGEPRKKWFSIAADTPFRALILAIAFVVARMGSVRFPLPQVPSDVDLACYLLGTGGLFLMGLSEDPFKAGLGLLTFLAGFDLLFGALEPSLVVAGLLGAACFLIALAVTFLAVTDATRQESGT
jgi:uncharacterized membrane protein